MASSDVSHTKTWGIGVSKTLLYVQSVEQKSLPTNSKYWLRETQIYDRSWYEKLLTALTTISSQYLELLDKLFCPVLYTYNSVFCTPVPQSFSNDTSAMGANEF